MENAVDALKIAFAMMVLAIALSVAITSFNKVKATSDVILYVQDETNYYEYQGASGRVAENRIVGVETIIPTLYRYYKENYTVLFKQGNYNSTTGQFSNVKYLNVYTTPANKDLWEDSYSNLLTEKYGEDAQKEVYANKKIFSFDLDEEILRHEPWTGTVDRTKSNLDAFLNGSTYVSPVNRSDYKNYRKDQEILGGFIEKYKNSKFVETIAEYTYRSDSANDSEIGSLTRDKTKKMIIFTLIK